MADVLTIVDACDPYAPGLAGSDQWRGPALTLLDLRPFDRLVLLVPHGEAARADALLAEVRLRKPDLPVERIDLPPLDAAAFLRAWWAGQWRAVAVACVSAGPLPLRSVWWTLADPPALVEVRLPRYITDEPAQLIEVVAPPAGSRDGVLREPAVAYRVEIDPEHYEQGWRRRAASSAGSPPPSLSQALRQLGLCGEHPSFRRVIETAATVAPHKVPVLLGGETGTGKGALARLLHVLSGRPADRWVALNCAALPETLAESILFGHKKGAFTGAASDQPGKFELADGGTLFLDEIGELPLVLQAKLLKVLEDGVVEPLGARAGRPVDVRVIAATNRDLKAAVAEKTFREDLFYRLSFTQLSLPPLRERRSDIHHLALHLVARINASLATPRRLAPSALARLEQHDWPGNIRDLENVIGRSLLLATRDELEDADLLLEAAPEATADALGHLPVPREGFSLEAFLDGARRQLILRALELSGGQQSAAARLLGLSPQAVHKFLKEQKE